MLQGMRSAAKYIWIVIVIAFIGGYLLLQTSGLLGRSAVTSGTAVGKVDGTTITYSQWINHANELEQEQERQRGRQMDADERAQIENQAFEELVLEIVLRGELKRRHIQVTDADIKEAARYAPPPAMMQSPELQTDGRFDPAKWERLLSSPAARTQGILLQLQQYYENELPKYKLYDQLQSGVFVSDPQLWQIYQDAHDSVNVSYVTFRATPGADSAAAAQVTDGEIAAYFNTYQKQLTAPARAVVTALVIPRSPTAADSAAAHDRAVAVRARLVKGEKFEDLAKELSDDSVSGKDGGKLPPVVKGQFVKEFDDAAFALKPGQLSEPVRTRFGWHLIRLDERKGDTVKTHHILISFRQGDSSAARSDRVADAAAKIAANAEDGRKLDSAAAKTGVKPVIIDVVQGSRAMGPDGHMLPGLSQWATSGIAKVGDVSDLFDADSVYFLARLDSATAGGTPTLDKVSKDLRMFLAHRKATAALASTAKTFASSAVSTSLEAAAKTHNYKIETSGMVTRTSYAPGLGQGNPSVGAAFALAVGAVSDPVVTNDAVYVVRVDKRVNADHTAWQALLAQQRAQVESQMQQDRVRLYLSALRDEANVVDKRKDVLATSRRQ